MKKLLFAALLILISTNATAHGSSHLKKIIAEVNVTLPEARRPCFVFVGKYVAVNAYSIISMEARGSDMVIFTYSNTYSNIDVGNLPNAQANYIRQIVADIAACK